MYRLSEFDFAVYIAREKLPSRAKWQVIANTKRFPLVFDEKFDPRKHPIRHVGQPHAKHPEEEVVAKIGEATCRYQLDIHDGFEPDRFTIDSQREALQGCNMALFFRWDTSAADCLAAYLSAATLALDADGVIIWGRTQEETRRGPEAFKVLTAKAWHRVKGPGYQFSKQDPFGPRLAMLPGSRKKLGEFECPRCGLPFDLDDSDVISGEKLYDGEKHTLCGQLLIAPA